MNNNQIKFDKNIRIALISFEHMHAMSYASVSKYLRNGELVAIADDDKERLTKVVKDLEFDPKKAYTDWMQMLDIEKPDAVMICSANSKHTDIAVECANRKLHIMCEKPLATNMEDCNRILEAAKKNNVKLMTAFPVRYAEEVKRARNLIQSGNIGTVLSCVTSNHGTMPGGWFVDPKLSGGGSVIDHTVHVIDILRWILDDEVESVYAEYDNRLYPEIPCEDVGILMLKFKKGTVVSLDTSWSRPVSFSTWGDVLLDIKGSKGNLAINCFPRSINYYSNATMRHTCSSPVAELDTLLVQELVDCIREDRQPFTSGLDGAKATEIAIAAYKAGSTRQLVRIS